SFLFVFVSVFLFSVLSFCYVFHSSVTYSCPPPLPSHHRHCLQSPLLYCFSSFFIFFFLFYLLLASFALPNNFIKLSSSSSSFHFFPHSFSQSYFLLFPILFFLFF